MYEEVFSDDSSTFTVLTRQGASKPQQRRGGGARPPSAWKERISDPEFHAIRLFNRETSRWERVYFYDNQYVKQGRVRHAITGNYFDIRAGDLAEHLLFKVCISMQKEPYTLFFHTPSEYERHFCVELSSERKVIWEEKQAYYYRELVKDEGISMTGNSSSEEELSKVIIVK
jgi:5-formaminoimidazole-4-carboxamide-1-beta-D-ribofuranosyl 5'-monophosphate synthetase